MSDDPPADLSAVNWEKLEVRVGAECVCVFSLLTEIRLHGWISKTLFCSIARTKIFFPANRSVLLTRETPNASSFTNPYKKEELILYI